jgi:hypothetical protein
MTFTKPFVTLLLGGGMAYASSLSVYQDKTFYTYTPKDTFIGFGKGISAKCEGNTVALSTMLNCPEEDRLCKVLLSTQTLKNSISKIEANQAVLEKLISLPQPTSFDAQSWISAAKLIGDEQATLALSKVNTSKTLRSYEKHFAKQSPTKEALQTQKSCKKELEVSIPYGYVSFSTGYVANIIDDKEVNVTQSLSIVNRSGIDIQADTAMFYYRSANQYVRATHFYPWIVSKYEPRPRRIAKKSQRMNKEVMMDSAPMLSMMDEEVEVMAIPAPIASYEDAREYKVTNLLLPSTGEVLDVKVLTWKAALSCELKAYPYANPKAFNVCSFKPKYQIDSNKWKITKGSEVINEKASGEYRGDKYHLYTQNDDDIKIIRLPMVQKERETGIFGGTARKKDGFTLVLINKSNKVKTLTVVERMPTSSTDVIKVKLLAVTAKEKLDYKLLENGKIEMKVTLAPNIKKEIEIAFEISYDKDIKVNY